MSLALWLHWPQDGQGAVNPFISHENGRKPSGLPCELERLKSSLSRGQTHLWAHMCSLTPQPWVWAGPLLHVLTTSPNTLSPFPSPHSCFHAGEEFWRCSNFPLLSGTPAFTSENYRRRTVFSQADFSI